MRQQGSWGDHICGRNAKRNWKGKVPSLPAFETPPDKEPADQKKKKRKKKHQSIN